MESSSVHIHLKQSCSAREKKRNALDQSERSIWSREQAQNLILHIFSVIFVIIQYSGMFRNVPGCSIFLVLSTAAGTSSILFHLVVENLILHIFLIIIIIIPCSGMFRNVPCSGFYRRPLQTPYLKERELEKET